MATHTFTTLAHSPIILSQSLTSSHLHATHCTHITLPVASIALSLSLSPPTRPLTLPIIYSPPVLDSKHHVYLGLCSRPRPRPGRVGADQVRLRCLLLCCCASRFVLCALCVLLTRTPSSFPPSSFSPSFFFFSHCPFLFRLLSGALMTLLFLRRTISITRYERQRQRETKSPCCVHGYTTPRIPHRPRIP